MMTGVIARAWKTVKPHVPMIKFRKGGTGGATANAVGQSISESASKSAPSAKQTSLPLIEDWELPSRYRRTALDESEISMINSGGAH